MQACSVLLVAHVLVGVRRVTVVHIGHEDVVTVIHFCVAIFVRDFLYQELFSLQFLDLCTKLHADALPLRNPILLRC